MLDNVVENHGIFSSMNTCTFCKVLFHGICKISVLYGASTLIFKKYKTFSVLIGWKNEKLYGNTTPAGRQRGRSVFTQFRVFPIFTSVDITVY